MIKVVCFDLDGTLLPMDQGRFIKGYIEALAAKVASVTPAQPFIKALLEATEAIVMQPEAGRKNEERFWEHFYRRLPLPPEQEQLQELRVQDSALVQKLLQAPASV